MIILMKPTKTIKVTNENIRSKKMDEYNYMVLVYPRTNGCVVHRITATTNTEAIEIGYKRHNDKTYGDSVVISKNESGRNGRIKNDKR
jgi:hypothetical protein